MTGRITGPLRAAFGAAGTPDAAAEPLRWGVLGARSLIYRQAIVPAVGRSTRRHVVVAAASQGAYDEVLANPEVQAVYVPLPNGLHAEWVERCAAAGKHVLCEKPLGRNAHEAARIITTCADAGVTLLEAYMTPHHPRPAAVVDLARSGGLGTLRVAHAAFTFPHPNPADHRFHPALGGGALLDVGIYVVAPLLAIAGAEPRAVHASAVTTGDGVDVSISARLEWDGGFAAQVVCSFEAPEQQVFTITGTGARLDVADRAFTPGPGDDRITLHHRDGRTEERRTGGADLYLAMLDRFAAVVRGRAEPVHSLTDTLRVATTLDRIRQAAGLALVGA